MRPAIALVAALALISAACGPSPSAADSSQPAASPSDAPVTPPTSTAPATAAPETPAPTEVPPPTEVPAEPTAGPSGGPSASLEPSVDTLKIRRYADCNADNGTSTVGYVKITWTASGTTGVRISIDPPSPDEAYAYGYADYQASGSAEIPFACDPPNHNATGDFHLYVVTTLHKKGGFYAFAYARVYQIVTESPAP